VESPHRHEYTASLRVLSETLSLDELSHRLGAPTLGYDKGDSGTPQRPRAPRKDAWLLESGLERSVRLDEHVAALVAFVESHRDELDGIRDACTVVDIFCGIFTGDDTQGGFAFEPELTRRLADLSLPVVFDIY
jgi:hypothetical protein